MAGEQPPTQAPAVHTPLPQLVQATPPSPHSALLVPARHEAPEQHPSGQFDALHAVLWQRPPLQGVPPQSRHEVPPVPHAVVAPPSWQTPPWQQPAHDDGVHWQPPARHSRPGPHEVPLPQRHWPATQRSAPMAAVQGGPTPQ